MLFSRLSLSLLALSSTALARSSPARTDSDSHLARRATIHVAAELTKRNVDLDASLEKRAIAELIDELNNLMERSLAAEEEEQALFKRGSCAAETTVAVAAVSTSQAKSATAPKSKTTTSPTSNAKTSTARTASSIGSPSPTKASSSVLKASSSLVEEEAFTVTLGTETFLATSTLVVAGASADTTSTIYLETTSTITFSDVEASSTSIADAAATTASSAPSTSAITVSSPSSSAVIAASSSSPVSSAAGSGSSTSSSTSTPGTSATLSGHFLACSSTIQTCGGKIGAAISKAGGGKASAATLVSVVKTEVVAIRVALAALAKQCVAIKASGKGNLTVTFVAELVVSLLLVIHTAFLEIITLAASLPYLVILLAGELLLISAQLVILLNALFVLVGKAALKAAISASLCTSVIAGFKVLGLTVFLKLIV